MSIDKIILKNMWHFPENWASDGARCLENGNLRVVRRITDERWAVVIGDIGQVKLSRATHMAIQFMLVGRGMTGVKSFGVLHDPDMY